MAAGNLATILIVEDDPGLARLQPLQLERHGYSIVVAGNYDEAIEQVRTRPIDLVLLDCQLPGGRTGLDVQAKLVELGYDLPVVVVRGQHDEATVIKALRPGVCDFVAKPAEYLDYLVDVVDRVLRQTRMERQLDKSQALLAGVVGSTIDAILTLDADGRVTLFNAAAERMFGCAADAALGERIERFVVDADRFGDAGTAMDRTGAGGQPRWEAIGRRVDGTEFPLEASISVGAVGGQPFQTLVLRDLTEQKRLEATLHEAEQRLRLRQKLEAVGSLAGGIAHEFNNLLQAILGYTSYAMRGLEETDSRYRDLDQVLRAGQRAATLTRQLLTFSRRQELNRTFIVLEDAIDEFAAMVRPLLNEDIEFTATCAAGMAICADADALQQALINLAINARDAMPRGGRLAIVCEPVELSEIDCSQQAGLTPGRYASIVVSDTGEGIPDDVRGRIFEPFFTTKEVGRGTGLGLPMVHGMVTQHQGAINVYSEVGKGTTFCIYLPLAEAGAASPRSRETVDIPRGTETILVAEDDPMVRELAARILREAGYRARCAVDGEDALRQYLECADELSLVMIDVVMPKMGGVPLYRRLKALGMDLPVVFCTGHAPNVSEAEVIAEQHFPLVQKPYASLPLLQTIRRALDDAKRAAVPKSQPAFLWAEALAANAAAEVR